MAFAGRSGPRTLRLVLAATGALLVVVVAGFLVAERLRAKNWVQGLPGRLGVGITQDSNSFTYDQSSKGKKIFTIHAAKEVQRADGKVSLHDVGIVLYGPAGQPADRIHGADFTYDQKGQLLTAEGEVFLDLVRPAVKDATGAPLPMQPTEVERNTVHVKTIGLTFDQKGQLASSEGPVEFRTDTYTGNSVGATYDAKNETILLRSQVRISGIRDERPVTLTAARAEMDRKTDLIDLETAQYVSSGKSGAETAKASHAVIHMDSAGNPGKIDAEGNVTLDSARGGTVVSDNLSLELGDRGQAQDAHLYGSVRYGREEGMKRERGEAEDARVSFDAAGRPVRALMNGKVALLEAGPTNRRELASSTLDLTLGGGGKEPTVVRAAEAFGPGGARLKLADESAKGRAGTDIAADRLVGRFAAAGKGTELSGLDGAGQTRVERVLQGPNGRELSDDTSTGDLLRMEFRPDGKGRSELTRAEQKGSVATVHQALEVKEGKPDTITVEHSRADDAVYEAGLNVAHLRGNVEVQDALSALTADTVDLNRGNGDASASGTVQVTYLNPPSPGAAVRAGATPEEPVHVFAQRAVAHKASGLAEFFGSGTELARMWQGSSQVEAPVLDLYQAQDQEKKLVAHGDGDARTDAPPMVRAVLVSTRAADAGAKRPQNGTTHILSREMVYTESARTVEFTGAVRVVDRDGVLRSNQATVWLTAAGPATGTSNEDSSSGFLGGRVDRMAASGDVEIDQPGRRGTGDKLVYTASDGIYVLTGTRNAPPKMVDQAQGMTTGAALRFLSRKDDRSVEVLGSLDGKSPKGMTADGKTAGRVRSETRMKR